MYLEVHASKIIVENMNTGKQYDFYHLHEAEEFIDQNREMRPNAEWCMLIKADY